MQVALLHARFGRSLQRFFTRRGLTRGDAEDLAQEVFLRLVQHRDDAALEDPKAFLFTIALNLVRDRARRGYTRAIPLSVSADELDLVCEDASPVDQLERDERLSKAFDTLAGLKPATRRAFLLHRIHGMSYNDVARELVVSNSMVEKHIMKAIAALRRVEQS
jgi:RNA polymerase sigma-70 factor (ECF subfamily)